MYGRTWVRGGAFTAVRNKSSRHPVGPTRIPAGPTTLGEGTLADPTVKEALVGTATAAKAAAATS
jgi:hypothetical protein